MPRKKNAPLKTASATDVTFRNPLHGGMYFDKKNDVEFTIDREQMAVLVRITDHMTNESFICQGDLTKQEV